MAKKYVVELTDGERKELRELTGKNKANRAKIVNAFILLKADRGGENWKDEEIAKAYNVTVRKIERTRRRFLEEGMEPTLNRKPRLRNRIRRIQGEEEAHLVALSCSKPPEGRKRWTVQLLAETMVKEQYIEMVSASTVWRTMKKK
jgi:transposase